MARAIQLWTSVRRAFASIVRVAVLVRLDMREPYWILGRESSLTELRKVDLCQTGLTQWERVTD